MMSCILLNPVLRANGITGEDSTSDMLKYLGGNTGNMVFVNAIKEQISFVKEDWLRQDTEFSSHDVYVLPCSNFLHFSNRWIEPLTDIIEKHPIKIVLVGLGAQADLNENMDSVLRKLSEKQKRFFQITAERSTSIGVRGEFTAECLGKLGIKNCKIIGCPSAYKFMKGEFPYMKSPSFKKSIVTITPGRGRISSNIMQMAMRNNSDWIMQSKEEIIDNNVIKDKIYFPRINRSDLGKYRNARAIMFWNFKEWNKYIQNGNYTFAYGTRFHGNMMALRNEVPTLWFVHDMRTWELVNALKVPAMVKDKRNRQIKEEELIDKCDYSEFYKYYRHNVQSYIEFLEENEIAIERMV